MDPLLIFHMNTDQILYFQLPLLYLILIYFSYVLPLLSPHPVGWGCRIRQLHLCRGVKLPATRLLVGCEWQPVMLEDGILVAVQSVTWQLKRSRDTQHSTLALTRLDWWLERPDPNFSLCTLDEIKTNFQTKMSSKSEEYK